MRAAAAFLLLPLLACENDRLIRPIVPAVPRDSGVEVDTGVAVDTGVEIDAGPTDSGADAGPLDSGADAGTPDTGDDVDTGTPDTGAADTGAVDTGTPDTGPVDTGEVDSGEIDAGFPDTGPVDTGAPDAGQGACAALYFDGASRVQVPHSASLSGLTTMTVEAWIRPEIGVVNPPWYPNVVGKRNTNNIYPEWVLGFSDTMALYTVADGAWAYGSAAISTGVWTHAAVVLDGAELRFYSNGNLDVTTPATGGGPLNTEDVFVGTLTDNTQNYQGDISAVRVSTIARYTGAAFAPQTSWTPDADTALLLLLDEGVGTVAGDSSGLGNNGAILGATWVAACP